MIAILGGLCAAAMWATSTLCTSRSSRMISPTSVLGWVLLIGTILSMPIALSGGVPDDLSDHVPWLLVTAVGNTSGLLFAYRSLHYGKVGVVAPITSAQGAAAAVLAVLAGEQIATGAGVALGVIVLGVVLASMARSDDDAQGRREGLAITFAIAAALCFGVGLFAMGRLSGDLPVAWIIFPSRLVAVVAVTVPLAALGRMRMTRQALPLVAASGVLEILGIAAYTIGARHGIAIAAVLSSQFAAMAAVAAYLLFRERLASVQVAGVLVIALGVATLTALQA